MIRPAPENAREGATARLAPGLYLVATPIGNLGDLTPRALDILTRADVAYAEDTRVTGKLLSLYGAKRKLRPYHEHNAESAGVEILGQLAAGASVALAADAGTPLVSDPGFRLTQSAIAGGFAVRAAPGASAVLAALVVSGLPSERFLFAGFAPHKPGDRRRFFDELASIPATLVYFETAPRLADSLAAAGAAFGPRQAAIARELTKLHEEVRRGELPALAAHYAEAGPPRGEIVVIIAPPPPRAAIGEDVIDAALRAALAHQSVREAATEIAARLGAPRKAVYSRALALKALMS